MARGARQSTREAATRAHARGLGGGSAMASHQLLRRALSTAPAAAASPSRVYLSAVIERGLVVFPQDPPWKVEHEARMEAWREAYALPIPQRFIDEEYDPRNAPRDTYMEAIGRVLDEHAGVVVDEGVHSLKRKYDQRLYLALRDADGEWGFPRAPADMSDGGPSMRRVLVDLLRAELGQKLRVLHISRAPIAHLDRGADGVDFFFRMRRVAGNVLPPAKPSGHGAKGKKEKGGGGGSASAAAWTDYAWLTREELVERLPAELGTAAERMLVE